MEQQQPMPQTFGTPFHQFGSSIILLTNPENALNKLELVFRNVRESEDGKLLPCGKPLMNNEGINSVIGTLQILINQISILSNFEKNEIASLIEFTADTLIKDLMINRVKYQMVSSTARDRVFFSLAQVFATLKRGYLGDDKKFWKGSVQEIHTRAETPKKDGILSRFNPWNKN